MEISLNDQQKEELRKGFDVNLRITPTRTMEVNMFTFAKYENDGVFNIMKLPENSTLYHGSWSLVDNLVYMPFGRNFDQNLRNAPMAIVSDKSEKFWEELGEKGKIQPAWLSFLNIAMIYNQGGEIKPQYLKDRGAPDTCSINKQVNILGKIINTTSCILVFKLLKTNKIVLLEDVFNIQKLRYLISTLTNADWNEIRDNLRRNNITSQQEYMDINNNNDLITALELVLWGPIDRNDGILGNGRNGQDYEGQYEPRVKFSDIRPEQEQGDGKNRFGRDLIWIGRKNFAPPGSPEIKIPFNRTSYYYYDIPCAYVLCWIINNKTPNNYDGMGNTYSERVIYDPGQNPIWPPEIFFCNAFGSLVRDYENPIDWQYQQYLNLSPKLRDYIINIDKKVITDYKNFKGDLLDITTWTALITERIMINHWRQQYQNDIIQRFDTNRHTNKYFTKILPRTQISDRKIFIGIISSFFLSNMLQYYCDNMCNLNSKNDKDLWFVQESLGTIISIDPAIINEIIQGLRDVRFQTNIISQDNLINNINLIIYMVTKILSNYILLVDSRTTIPNVLQELLQIFTRFSYSPTDGNDPTTLYSTQKIDTFIRTFNLASLVSFSFVLQRFGPQVIKNNDLTNYNSNIFNFLRNRSYKYPGRTDNQCDQNIRDFIYYQNLLYDQIDKLTDRSSHIFKKFQTSDIITSTLDHPNIFEQKIKIICDNLIWNKPVVVDWNLGQLKNTFLQLGGSQKLIDWVEDKSNIPSIEPENYKKLFMLLKILELKIPQTLTKRSSINTNLGTYSNISIDIPYPSNIGDIGNILSELLQAYFYYSPLFEKVNLEMHKYLFVSLNLNTISGDNKHQLLTILNVTKNIYSIICNNYGMKGYPLLIANPPRFNHNILNWLRSLWFVNKFLLESSVIENNSLTNTDIVLIQLGTFLKSSGRVNESNTLMTMKYSQIKNILDIDVPITGDQDPTINAHVLKFISACIAKDILHYIGSLDLNTSPYYKYLVLSLIITPTDSHFKNFPEDFQEFAKITSIGHYLDHCRPTTGFSQLDSEVEGSTGVNDPKGPKWLKEILNKYKLTRKWSETKREYLQYQREILERSGYNIYEPDRNKNSVTDYDTQYRCRNLWDRSGSISQKFVDLSTNFEDAWSTIVMDL